jgi:hypothetical protein
MSGFTREGWQKNKAGLIGSALLHIAFVALILFWSLALPARHVPPLKAILIDLVKAPASVSGTPGGAAVVRPQPRAAVAPKRIGEAPNAVQPLPDEVEARIAALANLRQAQGPLFAPGDGGAAAGRGAGDFYALADFVRAQILRKWWPALETDEARGIPVAIKLKLDRAGVISDIRIVDQQRFATDKQFRSMALSARNAAMLASPIPLPPGKYDAVTEVAITLDPRAVLR